MSILKKKEDNTNMILVTKDEHNKIRGISTSEFMVVYEDMDKNRHAYQTRKVGKTIQDIIKNHDIIVDLSKASIIRLNKDPYVFKDSKRVLPVINCYGNENKYDDNDIEKGIIFILPILPSDIV